MKFDVAVVGGGAIGLSTALHCALRTRSVVVVERAEVGSQASGRAAGLFKSVQPDRIRTRIAQASIRKVVEFEDWAGVPLNVQHSGSVFIARTERHKALLRAELDQARAWGVNVGEVRPDEIAERVSTFNFTGNEAVGWCPDDVYVAEPGDLMRAYLSACRLHDVHVLEHEPLVAITASNGAVNGVETALRHIEAAIVVDAAGAWSRQIGDLLGAAVPVCAVRHQLLITEPSDAVRETDPITRVLDAAVYMRPARGGLMFGGFEADPQAVDPRQQAASFTTDDVPLDLAILQRLAASITPHVPALATSRPVDHRGGLFTMTPDGRFLAGPVRDIEGLWVASGCNGSGFSCSPGLGDLLAQWIATGAEPEGMELFDPARWRGVSDDVIDERGVWQYSHYYDPADEPAGPLGK